MEPLDFGKRFEDAFEVWIEGKAKNTRTSYLTVWRDFVAFLGGKRIDQVTAQDVTKWKQFLKQENKDTTVAQRLSVISGFYSYLQNQNLYPYNPVKAVGIKDLKLTPYGHSRKIALKDFMLLLQQIDTSTVVGTRDFAILLFYVMCAHRREEVLSLKWEDIQTNGDSITYTVESKRGKVETKQMPPILWVAIQKYLEMSNRVMNDNSPLFVATVDTGNAFREYYGVSVPKSEKALTGEHVIKSFRRYAEKAGIDKKKITLHSLRHLGAEMYMAAGASLEETQDFLGHKHINTTQIYMRQIKGKQHKYWREMARMLGL